ncbi:MAG: TetR/AcrR family transcriptional regulator [Alphaproteobacteria bacterium]
MSKQDEKKSPLDVLEPAGLGTEDQGWQARKSAQTRVWILEAAIDCLGEVGYAGTTTQLIARRADISRGAMLHHYATKADLIAGVIEYTFFQRMKQLSAQVADLSEAERVEEQAGLELLWQSMQGREYTAYLELLVASRTDKELKAIFAPKARRFDNMWREEILKMFPEWRDKQDRLELAIDFSHSVMEGLLVNRGAWDKSRRQAVRQLLNTTIKYFRDGEIEPRNG